MIGTWFAAGRVFVSIDNSDSNRSGKKANSALMTQLAVAVELIRFDIPLMIVVVLIFWSVDETRSSEFVSRDASSARFRMTQFVLPESAARKVSCLYSPILFT